jgi:hypothetical protein
MKRILFVLIPLCTFLLVTPNISIVRASDSLKICVKENGLMFGIGKFYKAAFCQKNDKLVTLNLDAAGGGGSGETGATGATGFAGATGATGIVGEIGPTGVVGPTGATGAVSEMGAGQMGPTGATGVVGVNGTAGQMGPTGATGSGSSGGGVTGPTGATGLDGPTGSTGSAGAAGVNGISGWEKIIGAETEDSTSEKTATADCTPGKKVIGGGFQTNNRSVSGEVAIVENAPLDDDTWEVIGFNDTTASSSYSLRAVVICATAL